MNSHRPPTPGWRPQVSCRKILLRIMRDYIILRLLPSFCASCGEWLKGKLFRSPALDYKLAYWGIFTVINGKIENVFVGKAYLWWNPLILGEVIHRQLRWTLAVKSKFAATKFDNYLSELLKSELRLSLVKRTFDTVVQLTRQALNWLSIKLLKSR